MAGPIQVRQLKVAEYPQGVSTPQDAQRLFAALNPMMEALKRLSNGVSISQNMDAQVVSFQVKTPATDWTDFTLTGGVVNVGAGEPNAGYRVDALGHTWVRLAVTTLPALNTAFATLPAAARPPAPLRFTADSNGAYGAVAVDSTSGNITQVVGAIGANPLRANFNFPSVNNSPGVYNSFPIQVRTKDGRKPQGVWLLFCADHSNANPANTPNSGTTTPSILVPGVQWSYLQNYQGQSFISIDGMPGLALGRTYDINLLVVY